MQNCFF